MEDKEPNIYPLLDLFLLAVFIFALSQNEEIINVNNELKKSFFQSYYISADNVLYIQNNDENNDFKKITSLKNHSYEAIANNIDEILSTVLQSQNKITNYICKLSYDVTTEYKVLNDFDEVLNILEERHKINIFKSLRGYLLEVFEKNGEFFAKSPDTEEILKGKEEIIKYVKEQNMIKGIMFISNDIAIIQSMKPSSWDCGEIKFILNNEK